MRQFVIYLPPTYSHALSERYPVIYLLHGEPGRMTDWFKGAHADTTANDLFSLGRARETIFVAPDGVGPTYSFSEWANSADGRQRMEDSIAHDLVSYVDVHYRTIASPAGRTIAGLSDGGYGATNTALHHPDVFGTVLSLDGLYQAARSEVFGKGSEDDAVRRYNSPAVFVTTPKGLASARALRFIIAVASEDHGYFQTGVSFDRELQELGLHADLMTVSGTHSWWTWGLQFAEALPLLEPPSATHPSSPGAH
jgi:enterochelin esterase-like enzyme